MALILLTLGLNNNLSLAPWLKHSSLSCWQGAKTITSRIHRSRGSPASLSVSLCPGRMTPTERETNSRCTVAFRPQDIYEGA